MNFCINCGAELNGPDCSRCGRDPGGVAVKAAMPPPSGAMDPLEMQLLLSRTQEKSPGFAAVLGFFFPWGAAFYTGKFVQGVIFLVVDVFFLLLSIIGIGIFFLLVYGFFGAYLGHKWAKDANQRALEKLLEQRRLAGR